MKLSKDDMIDAMGFLNFLIERNLISPEEMPQTDEQLKIWFKHVRHNIDRTEAWAVYHKDMGATKYMLLNTTAIPGTNTYFHDTTPTSTLFYVGNAWQVNKSGDTYMAYCFTSIKGYSKIGSYFGNGAADGAFVHTGFRPAYVMINFRVPAKALSLV